MRKIKTVLFGMGTVNQGVLNILKDKTADIVRLYGIEFIIVAVADSSGIAIQQTGFAYDELIQLKKSKKRVKELAGYDETVTSENLVEKVVADVLIESSPGNLRTGNPGLQVSRDAFKKGWSVVLANKVPLVFAFDELHALAEKKKAGLSYSATVCGGLPVINVLQRDMKLTTLRSFKGILNATTNYILNELDNGGSRDEAIREAQRIGAAEADPSYDVEGYDTANKLFIIMKSFTDYTGSIADISIHGIQTIDAVDIRRAKENGNTIKLLALAEREGNQWKLSVKPTHVPMSSFLGTCHGWEMGIELTSDLYESVAMKNYEADPVGTSAAVIRDAIELFKGR